MRGRVSDDRQAGDASVRPSLAHRRVRRRRAPSLAGSAALGAAVLTVAAICACALLPGDPARSGRSGDAAVTATAASPVTWIAISHPLPLYGVSALPSTPTFEARRTSDGTARQDMLTYGAFGDTDDYLTLALRRTDAVAVVTPDTAAPLAPPRPDSAPDALVDLVRLAATSGLAVVHAGVAETLPTRLGAFALAPLTLQRDGLALPCLGARLADAGALSIAGLACTRGPTAPDRAALACLLDHLVALGPGDDGPVHGLFARAERPRAPTCPPLAPLRSAARSAAAAMITAKMERFRPSWG